MGDLGIRYKCFECETKFYDLGRPLPLCPSCGKDQNDKKINQPYKRKKWHSSFKKEPEIHVDPEDSDSLLDPDGRELPIEAEEKDKDEDGYLLEEEDIAIEEKSENPQEDSDEDDSE